jgi:RES domain/HEPN/RES N-terminal domain 1
MKCCENCFEDNYLKRFVREHGKRGDCDHCGDKRRFVLAASELHDTFKAVFSLFEPYHPAEHSVASTDTLATCMNCWPIFSIRLDDKMQCQLLDDIRQIYRLKHDCVRSDDAWVQCSSRRLHVSEEEVWETFVDEIKWKRRFIFRRDNFSLGDPKDWLPDYLPEVTNLVSAGKRYYRARLRVLEGRVGFEPLPAKEMGPPPPTRTHAGRANPAGIPYLYVAEEEETAVAEIRPHIGAVITIATVISKTDLKVIDLTNCPFVTSPFGHANLTDELRKAAILRILNDELSKPIEPDIADIEYLPTQYLAEAILDAGYDGILYASSVVKGGKNVVFFDADRFTIRDTRCYQSTDRKSSIDRFWDEPLEHMFFAF